MFFAAFCSCYDYFLLLLLLDFCLGPALFSAIFILQVMHFCQVVVSFLVGCFPLLFPIVTIEKWMYFLYVSLEQKDWNRIEVIFKCIHPLWEIQLNGSSIKKKELKLHTSK